MLALGKIAGVMESTVELGKARNWTTQRMLPEAMVNILQRPSAGGDTWLPHCSFPSHRPPLDTAPSTEVARVAEGLKENLVHPMVMLYCPRGHVRFIAGK